jgi:thiol-disulfide isomerase/thioredoxin
MHEPDSHQRDIVPLAERGRCRRRFARRLLARLGAVPFLVELLRAPPASARRPGELPIGGLLPDLTLRGLNGPARRLGAYRGRPLLINVWASWCGPCVQEMASLERLAWHEGRTPFALIGISTDDTPEPAQRFLERSRATISHFLDHDLQMETLLGAGTIPLTVLVDASGRIIEKITGAREWDDDESLRLLARAFRAPPPPLPRGA